MGDRACHFAKKQDLYPYLKELVHKESYCTFLVKGSHSMHMEEVIAFLKQVGAAEI